MDYFNFNFYNCLDATTKNIERNSDYIKLIYNMFFSMFTFKGMAKEYSDYLIATVLSHGSAYVKKVNDDKYIICGGHYKGIPEPDEIYPSEYICSKPHFSFDGRIGDNETIVKMSFDVTPFTWINRIASQLAEIDTSLVNNIQFARIAPIAVVSNDRVRELYEKALKKMLSGELVNSILSALNAVSDKPSSLTTLDISDGKYSEKIQYLAMHRDWLISKLCEMCGIRYNVIDKHANITNDELHNTDSFTSLNPRMYKTMLNNCLNKIGVYVEFSEQWDWIDKVEHIENISIEDKTPSIESGDNNDVSSED